MRKSKKSKKKHNKFVEGLLLDGTIFIPSTQSDYDIIKIDEFDTYYQIYYKYDIKITPFNDKTRSKVSWIKVSFKNINQHLRKEKIKQLKENVNKR